MERRFSQVFVISFTLLLSISILNTQYIYAGVLKEEAGSYREKGYEAQERGDIDTAISLYQKAAKLDPNYAAPHNDLGILYETKGWLDRAEAAYQKALVVDSDYEKAHTNLALLYERKGELERAAFHWMRRYKLGKPGDPWTEKARQRLEKIGLIDKGEKKTFREKVVEKPQAKPKKKKLKKEPSEWTRIGSRSKKQKTKPRPSKQKTEKKISEARERDLNRELQKSLKLAEERLRKGKSKKIRAETKGYRRTRSKSGTRTNYLTANNYYKRGEYSKALDIIRTAKKDYPKDSGLLELEETIKNKMKEERIEDHYNEGIMHYRQKDFSGARKEFEAMLNILPE